MLDTGIKTDDYNYYRDCELIGGYKDFVNTHCGEVKYDETGHGSTAVSILAKMCPNASLYLARVLRTNTATSTDVENVVKAIKWAVSKQVDIITMAIGFKQDQTQIAKAIHDARTSNILIFSAASNSRNIDPIYFPASWTDQVFGIFSTNAGIRESRSLNPSPGNRPHSFAIFGEDVELSEAQDLVSGASYSTSMAAGLAGMLLDFSRQKTDRNEFPDISRVREMRGMMVVFREMATRDGMYECIRPWSLLKDDFKCDEWELRHIMRNKQRDYIRGTIDRLLEKMYR